MYQSKRLSKIRDKEISELRDTPPEFIASLFNSKSSSGSDLYCLSLNIRISEFWLSEALDQHIRAELQISVSELFYQSFALGQSIRALVFRISWSILVPVDLSKNIFKYTRVRMFENFCLSNPLLFKISFLFSPFLSAIKKCKWCAKTFRAEKLVILKYSESNRSVQ